MKTTAKLLFPKSEPFFVPDTSKSLFTLESGVLSRSDAAHAADSGDHVLVEVVKPWMLTRDPWWVVITEDDGGTLSAHACEDRDRLEDYYELTLRHSVAITANGADFTQMMGPIEYVSLPLLNKPNSTQIASPDVFSLEDESIWIPLYPTDPDPAIYEGWTFMKPNFKGII